MFYANSRSIVKPGKLDELRCVIESFKNIIHLIILSETWIKNEEEAKRVLIPNYTHYYNFRHNKKGGGVSIFVHNSLKHNFIEELCVEDNHFLWIHIEKFCLDIGAVYKPERTNNKNFFEIYSHQLQKRKRAIVVGDLNFDLLNIANQAVKDYKNVLKENNFSIINKIKQEYCTRETTTTKTILDHVCTNINNQNCHFTIIESNMSDHKQIYFEIKKYQQEPIKKVVYEAMDYKMLYKNMEEILNNTFEDYSYEMLEMQIRKSILLSKISRTKILNRPKQEWINKEILRMINERNFQWLEYKSNKQNKDLEEKFKQTQTKVTEKILHTKNTYYRDLFAKNSKKPKKMWSLINDLAKNKIKDISGPGKLVVDSRTITEENEICDHFNIYFSTIGSVLANEISDKYHNYRQDTYNSMAKTELHEITPTTAKEISKIINNFDPNTSSGIDGISTKSIICIKDLIASKLATCINKCLEHATFPDSLKIAKVTPIYKSGSKLDPSNYRPISVLPVISKVFERILYDRLDKFLNSNKFFSKKQYGFRPKSNTLSATIDLVTKIKNKIDQKQIAVGVFIDLKKAFDTVSHNILIKKLSDCGVKSNALNIFKSYLLNRQQIIKIGDSQSTTKQINYGVPQGSILGPLLFLIYINEISQIGLSGDITLYADDTSLFYFGHTINAILTTVQKDLDRVNEWFQQNLLTINTNKTNYIIFAAKNKKYTQNTELKINGKTIQKKSNEKYLGLILDSYLNFKRHIEKIKNKLMSLTASLRGIVKCLPRPVRYLIYNSLVKPHIDYLIEIWGPAAKSNIGILQTAQNKLVKTLFGYHFRTPTDKIYKNTKLMTIKQTYFYYTCILIRKILNKEIQTQMKFTTKGSHQKIQLRNSTHLVLRQPRTNYGMRNIEYEGAQMYNKLPTEIKDTKCILLFKKLLKDYIKTYEI